MKQSKTFIAAVAFAVVIAMALPVLAVPETAHQAIEGAITEGEREAKSGLPQLDYTLFPEQLFWLTLSFGLLYVMMAYVGLPAVKQTQDRRTETIGGDLAAAQAANEAARNMMAEYEKALADARAKAQATVSEISAEAAREAAVKQAEQQTELMKRLADAEARIAAARDAAVKDVKGTAIDLAMAIVEKVTAKPGARHAA